MPTKRELDAATQIHGLLTTMAGGERIDVDAIPPEDLPDLVAVSMGMLFAATDLNAAAHGVPIETFLQVMQVNLAVQTPADG